MRKRLLATLLSLCLVVGLFPTAALAVDEELGGDPSPVCTCTALCTEEAIDEACEVCKTDYAECAYTEPVPPDDAGNGFTTCTMTEGCTLADGHEGVCVLPDCEPDGTNVVPLADDNMSGSCGAEGNENDVTWKLEQNNADSSDPTYTLTISGSGAMANYSSGTGQPWNSTKTSITSIVVSDGITNIGDRAFMGCSNLTSLTVADSVTSYGTNIFNGCTSLTSLSVGENVTEIGQIGVYTAGSMTSLSVAEGNTNYASIENWLYELNTDGTATLWQVPKGVVENRTTLAIPESIIWNGNSYTVTAIGKVDSDSYTLSGATALTTISFGNQITEIGYNAFKSCIALTTVSLENITTIGTAAFSGCSSLNNLTLGNKLGDIPNNAFENCSALSSITIPATVTTIGRYAFCGSGLTTINIPVSVTKIDDFAFQSCQSLKSISGGAGLETLGSAVFLSSPIETVNIIGTDNLSIPANTFAQSSNPEAIKNFTLTNGSFASGFEFKSKDKLESVALGVTTIPGYLFQKQSNLKSVTLLDGVTTIGNYAFAECAVNTLVLPDGVTTIGGYAFSKCGSIETLVIPNSVMTIGKFAFDSCTSLKTVHLGAGLTSLGEHAFNACTSLIVLDMSDVESDSFLPTTQVMINRTSADLAIVYVLSSELATTWGSKGTTNTTCVAVTNDGIVKDSTTSTENAFASPVKHSYIFGGWYESAEFTGDKATTAEAGKTYYAKWTEAEDYSVDIHSITLDTLTYGESPVSKSVTVSYTGDGTGSIKSVSTSNDYFTAETSDSGLTVTIQPAADLDAGTYTGTVYITTGEDSTFFVDVSVTVLKAGSTVTPGEDESEIEATYGDIITFEAKTAKAENSISLMAMLDEVVFKYGDTVLGTAYVDYEDNTRTSGTATLRYNTSEGGIPVSTDGVYVVAEYGGSVNLNGSYTNSIKVTLAPKELTVTGLEAVDRIYDGTTTVALTGGTLSGVLTGDDVSVTMPTTGTVTTAEAGSDKPVTIPTLTLSGDDAEFYTLKQPTGITVNITEEAPANTIVITAQDVTAYTGGDSISNDPFPTARYKVDAGEGVELSEVTFTVGSDEHTLADAESGDVMLLSWLDEGFTLQPQAAIAMLADGTADDDGEAGVYTISATNWDEVSASADDAEVNLQFVPGTLTVRNVSNPEGVLDKDNPLDIAQKVVSSEADVDTSDGIAVAVIPADATYRTNGKEALDVLGADKTNPTSGAQIALLFDNILERDTVSGNDTVSMLTAHAATKGHPMTSGQYEFKYLDLINESDGNAWVSTDKTITIFWPYPDAVKSNYNDYTFSVLHFEGLHREYQITSSADMQTQINNSNVELISATKTAQGVKFTLPGNLDHGSFSPFALTWTKDNTGSSSSGGGSSSGSTTYAITVENSRHGEVDSNRTRASSGTTVTLTVTPDEGYVLDELTVTDKNGDTVKLTNKGNGKYTFTMPRSAVTVEASFVPEADPDIVFIDVPADAYYGDAVAWAVENGITNGTSATTFSPDASCTRAQMVTFLWRAAGSPEPTTTNNPFTDVSASAYYYEAVLWAVEQGITNGTSVTTFSPDATVTRGQTVTFLWRFNGSPAVSSGSFADVPADAYYADAVAWAVAEGITNGTSTTTFSPDNACTRAQIVTFLYRDLAD